MKRSLLITLDFPPVISGIATVFYNVWKHYDPERMLVMTGRAPGDKVFDNAAPYRPIRVYKPFGGGIGKLIRMFGMFLRTGWLVVFRGVREIHAGLILSAGPTGLFFQYLFGIPCYLWLYGGETTDAYRRSRFETFVVDLLIRDSAFLVTNSPATTQEFLDIGIPAERIIEILPAVDADVFSPEPRSSALMKKLGIADDNAEILLTVSRLTPRKGHDLVIRAMALLRDRPRLRYVIVGAGDDRGRLEALAEKLGLTDRVIFAGRVDDKDLPDYYRLCDIYVMPNREVLESTDSIEGFGISFIEANACGKPSIGGRSGGAGAAVVDGVTGWLVDPESPGELAEKIAGFLDNPESAAEMGRNGRERVIAGFSWKDRAETLARRLTIDAMKRERT